MLEKHEQLLSRESEIQHLKLLIAKLRRLQFGRKSEKLDRHIEQLELRLEELETRRGEAASPPESKPQASRETSPSSSTRTSSARNADAPAQRAGVPGLRR